MGNSLFDCTGKVTMVTGGNSGLGFGFAMGCAKMGGDVAIWARNEEKNAIAAEKLLAALSKSIVDSTRLSSISPFKKATLVPSGENAGVCTKLTGNLAPAIGVPVAVSTSDDL